MVIINDRIIISIKIYTTINTLDTKGIINNKKNVFFQIEEGINSQGHFMRLGLLKSLKNLFSIFIKPHCISFLLKYFNRNFSLEQNFWLEEKILHLSPYTA